MAPPCCIYFFPLLFFCFPLNSNHGIEPAAALTYRAFLLITFLPFVLLPMISVSLTIGTLVPSALNTVYHVSARTHPSRSNLNHSSFLAHSDLVLIVLFFRAVPRYSCNIGSTVLPFSQDRDYYPSPLSLCRRCSIAQSYTPYFIVFLIVH